MLVCQVSSCDSVYGEYRKSHVQLCVELTDNHTRLPPAAHSAEGHYAQKLLNDLMENYSSALRPVEDTDRALNVTLQITLSQIKDMVGPSSPLIKHTWSFDKIFLVKANLWQVAAAPE